MDHLDPLALDAARAGEAPPEAEAHLAACADCRAEVDALRELAARLAGPDIDVPEALDRAVLAAAARRLRRRRWWIPAAAAAAVLAGVVYLLRPAPAGRVDIVDAYRLATRLEAGEAVDRKWDVNRDGTVDIEDVHHLARLSVRLEAAG